MGVAPRHHVGAWRGREGSHRTAFVWTPTRHSRETCARAQGRGHIRDVQSISGSSVISASASLFFTRCCQFEW